MNYGDVMKIVSMSRNDMVNNRQKVLASCHPDRNRENEDVACSVFKYVSSIIDADETKIGKYTVSAPKKFGSRSVVYETTDGKYILKVAMIPSQSDAIRSESETLKALHKIGVAKNYFPTLVDSFSYNECLANVFLSDAGFIPLNSVSMISGRHVSWIFNRLMEAASMLADSGLKHWAMCPPHILVNPEKHSCRIVGLCSASSGAIRSVDPDLASWYPKSINERMVGIDTFFASKSVILISDSEPRILKFFRGCTPFCDPRDILVEFSKLLSEIYGKREFVNFDYDKIDLNLVF